MNQKSFSVCLLILIACGNMTEAQQSTHVMTRDVRVVDPMGNSLKDAFVPSPIRGTIVGNKGPVVGAEVYWWRSRVHDIDPMKPVLAVTDAKGQFELLRTTPSASDPAVWDMTEEMAVRARNHGFRRTSPIELGRQPLPPSGLVASIASVFTGSASGFRLESEGTPIQGRLVDIEGQPIEGAQIRIRWFSESKGQYSFENANENNSDRIRDVSNLTNVIEHVPLRNALPITKTDENGRFELRELPGRSFFELLVERSGIESMDLVVRNFGGSNVVTVSQSQGSEHNPPTKVYPAKFEAVIGPSYTVAGLVTDSNTQQPIPDALIRATRVHGQRVTSSREREHFATRTDAKGRYKISGLPIGEGNHLEVFATGGVPYVPLGFNVNTSKASGGTSSEVIQDFQITQGLWAEGRVYDNVTNEPFKGRISYYWFRNRELEAQQPGLKQAYLKGRYFTDQNGRFRIPVLPVAGVIAFSTDNRDHNRLSAFPRGYGEYELINYRQPAFPHYDSFPFSLMPGNYERLALVRPEPDQQIVKVDLPLLATKPIPVKIFEVDGAPVDRTIEIYGGNERWGWQKIPAIGFEVVDLLPAQRRKVFAFDRKQNLVGGTIVDHEPDKAFEIRLALAGSVRGRLLDGDGLPITDAMLSIEYGDFQTDQTTAIWADQVGKIYMPNELTVDEQGRFEILGLSSQWKYTARANHRRKKFTSVFGYVFRDLAIQLGETRDLGDIKITIEN